MSNWVEFLNITEKTSAISRTISGFSYHLYYTYLLSLIIMISFQLSFVWRAFCYSNDANTHTVRVSVLLIKQPDRRLISVTRLGLISLRNAEWSTNASSKWWPINSRNLLSCSVPMHVVFYLHRKTRSVVPTRYLRYAQIQPNAYFYFIQFSFCSSSR